MTLQELEEKIYEAGILGLNRLAVGSDLTLDELQKHLLRKPYLNQQIVNRSVSDATDGYHIRSGKDYGELASGNLPLGGIPAALAGIAYQQATGIKDSSLLGGDGGIFGTIGPNALLQSADNIEGLRQSGKAPALDALYDFGGGIYNLFNNPSSIDVTALGGPRAKGNVFNQGTIDVNSGPPRRNSYRHHPGGYNIPANAELTDLSQAVRDYQGFVSEGSPHTSGNYPRELAGMEFLNEQNQARAKMMSDSLAMDSQLARGQVPSLAPTGTTVIPTVSTDLEPHTSSTPGPAGATTLEIANSIIRRDGVPRLAKPPIDPVPFKVKKVKTVPKVTPASKGPAGYSRPTTQSAAPVFKSYGPPNMQRF